MASVPAFTREYPFASPSPRTLSVVLLTVFCATLAGVTLSWLRGVSTPVWVGTAVMMYWLARTPNRDWPTMIAVCWLANIAAALAIGRGVPRAILLPSVNLLEALLLAIPLRAFRFDSDFAQPRTLAVFYALVLGPSSMISASLGALFLNRLTGEPFSPLWSDWYISTALGQAMLVPPLMVLRGDAIAAIFSRQQLPGTLLNLAIVAGAIAINVVFHDYPLGFLFFPAVVLITFQRGFAGGVIGLALVVAYMLMGLEDIHSTLPAPDARLHLIFVELYTAMISFTVIVVGAGLELRRKLEQSLAAAREEAIVARDGAQAASRAKTMFLANMSHELRTPLNAVIGFSDLMHRELNGPLGHARYRDYAKLIHDAGTHLLDVIGDILDMSKIEVGKHEIAQEEMQLDALVRECCELMRERATARDVDLATDLAGPNEIVADHRAMKQILLNLLSNAVKFTPAGGVITVATKAKGDRLVLSVTDTGIGIAADDLHRLAQPFVQLKRTTAGVAGQPGTGLGLALVRTLVERHGGTLVIESEEGQGTCARIEVPLQLPVQGFAKAVNA